MSTAVGTRSGSARGYQIEVLDEAVLDLPLSGFRADEEIFREEPLCVRDAFFFRGIWCVSRHLMRRVES